MKFTLPNLEETGIIIVDHGSRRAESNEMLLEVVAQLAQQAPHAIIEPAHMELAEPSIAHAFARCVARGARRVIIHPYFLLPGRHWSEDIPNLARAAAAQHDHVEYLVTAPLGAHPLMSEIICDRIRQCLAHASGDRDACDVCIDSQPCEFRATSQRTLD